jgi:hypothetical protein
VLHQHKVDRVVAAPAAGKSLCMQMALICRYSSPELGSVDDILHLGYTEFSIIP